MTPPPPRRWFRWSLRTLFVVVTVVGSSVGYQVHWIRQRHEFLERNPGATKLFGIDCRAPGLLWLFGEVGTDSVVLDVKESERTRPPQSLEVVQEARRLFPEAVIYVLPHRRPAAGRWRTGLQTLTQAWPPE